MGEIQNLMHLKKLTLSLLAVSLSACSTHMIKSNNLNASQSASERAVQGLNALYEYPSFDYRGQIKLSFDDRASAQNLTASERKSLDFDVEKKVNQYLLAQKIILSEQEKKTLYQALAQQDSKTVKGFLGEGAKIVEGIFSDLKIQYDGTVNYRQKIASFNLETHYKKPNLSVEMRIPTILDLNNYRFYTHIFSLMPYLANAQDQDKYAYYDFSKYKKEVDKVNAKALIELLKQSGATTYLVSPPNEIESLAVSSAEKKIGVVEKIRLNTTIEELLLQGSLYSTVNKTYFLNTVLGLKPNALLKSEAKSDQSADQTTAVADSSDGDTEALDASSAMYKLYDAVNHQVYGAEPEAEGAAEDAGQSDDESDQSSQDESSDESASPDQDDSVESSEKILTEQQCEDLAKTKSNVHFGDVNYCSSEYEIDLLSTTKPSDNLPIIGDSQQQKNNSELVKKFETYGKDQLIDANQFKVLWDQNSAEIEASLPPKIQRNPLIVDLSLDNQGRLIKADYDLGIAFDKAGQKMNIKLDMLISNYGNASKIDPNILQQAKPFKDVFKGSFLERAVGGFAGKTGLSDGAEKDSFGQTGLSLDGQLTEFGKRVYRQTASYEQTYKAVFIAKLTAKHPDWVKQYTTQDLQEIGAVYAYAYSDEEFYNPKGQALKSIETLKKKHHLEDDAQYDDDLGTSVDAIVVSVSTAMKSVVEIQKLQNSYKSTEAIFAQYYMQKFEADNDVSKSQRSEFVKTAHVLAKAYIAFKKHNFSESNVSGLNEQSVEFIDYDLFKQTFQVMSDADLK